MATSRQFNSLDELRAQEKDLLGQIAAYPNGARLFLSDPVRLLAEFGVTLAPATREAWTRLLGDPSALDGDTGLFDAIKAAVPTAGTGEVRIRALLPPALTQAKSS